RLQLDADVLRRVGQELRRQAFREQPPASLLGIEELAVAVHGRLALGLVVADGVELAPGALQVAGEDEQLEKEEPAVVTFRGGLALPDFRVDGVLQPAGLEAFGGVHGGSFIGSWGRGRPGERRRVFPADRIPGADAFRSPIPRTAVTA